MKKITKIIISTIIAISFPTLAFATILGVPGGGTGVGSIKQTFIPFGQGVNPVATSSTFFFTAGGVLNAPQTLIKSGSSAALKVTDNSSNTLFDVSGADHTVSTYNNQLDDLTGTAILQNLSLSNISGTQCLHVTGGGVVAGTGSDCGGGSGGNSKWATTTNNSALTPNGGTSIGAVLGRSATTTNSLLEVNGTTTASIFVATTTTATSTFNGNLYVNKSSNDSRTAQTIRGYSAGGSVNSYQDLKVISASTGNALFIVGDDGGGNYGTFGPAGMQAAVNGIVGETDYYNNAVSSSDKRIALTQVLSDTDYTGIGSEGGQYVFFVNNGAGSLTANLEIRSNGKVGVASGGGWGYGQTFSSDFNVLNGQSIGLDYAISGTPAPLNGMNLEGQLCIASEGCTSQLSVASGQIQAPFTAAFGTGAPAYTFAGDLDTGIQSYSANTVQIVAGGSVMLSAQSNGIVMGNAFTPIIGSCLIDYGTNTNKLCVDGASASLVTNSVTRLYTGFTGNVGIGNATTTPWGLLSVEMDTTNPSFVVSNQGSTTPAFIIRGVNQNGNIGLSTTTPDSTLDVNGSVRLEGASTIVTTSISGAIVGLGCDSADTTGLSGLASTTAFITTPQIYPGDGLNWFTYALSATSIRTKVCSDVTVTPTASVYTVKIIK